MIIFLKVIATVMFLITVGLIALLLYCEDNS